MTPSIPFRLRHAAIATATLVALLLLAGCGNEESSARAAGNSPGGPGGEHPAVPIAVVRASLGDASSYYKATATLEAENQAQVQARVSGVVREILHEEGDFVKKGDLLARLEDEEARYRLQQAAANLRAAEAEYKRRAQMRDSGLLSAGEFETTENTLAIRKAELGLADVDLSHTKITAPFTGRVVRRYVDLGANVTAGTPLFEVMDDNPLLARVFIPTKRMGFVKVGQKMSIHIDSTGDDLVGVVRLISPIVDETTGTVKVTAEIQDHPAGTRAGDFAEVSIVTAKHTDTPLVPSQAVFEEQGQHVLYVVQDTVAVRRVVETGFVDGDDTEVTSGVAKDELVVVKGQRELRDGATVQILEGPPDVLAANREREDEKKAAGTGHDAS